MLLGTLIFGDVLWANPSRVVDFSLGGRHACALFDNSNIKCWGRNDFGQLGLGDTMRRGDDPLEMGSNLPYVFLGLDFNVVSIQAGSGHTCAINDEGGIKCWGDNFYGQLGRRDFLKIGDDANETGDGIPYLDFSDEFQTDGKILKFVVGHRHNCALFKSGRVKCFGYNSAGTLGIEMKDQKILKHLSTFVNFPRKVSNVFVDDFRTCLLDELNELYCFGVNSYGSGGQEKTGPIGWKLGDISNLKPIKLGTSAKVVDVSGETFHTCVSFENELPKCFGRGINGELGIGSTVPVGRKIGDMGKFLVPVQFPNFSGFHVSGGLGHNCGLDSNMGQVFCWGIGSQGQLGLGSKSSLGGLPGDIQRPLTPVSIGVDEFVLKIETAIDSSCALLRGPDNVHDLKIKCWGSNIFGQLGQGHISSIGDDPMEMGENLRYIEF